MVQTDHLLVLTEQALAEARRELEQTGRVTPRFIVRLRNGKIQSAAFDDELGECLNDGHTKDQLFAGIRRIIRLLEVEAISFVTDTWMGRATIKGLTLHERDPAEFAWQTQQHGFEEAVKNGLVERL